MLAGFLSEIKPQESNICISCCIPYNLDILRSRFPEVNWYPYTTEARESCINSCDVWLGLGGSPFQSSVSSWFIDHLAEEHRIASKFHKPMAFLGIGSQDDNAFNNSVLTHIMQSSNFISARDFSTYKALLNIRIDHKKIYLGADLSHLFFSRNLAQFAHKGRLTMVLNSDYKSWPNLNSLVSDLSQLRADEQIWLIQESRPLPGSEQDLYQCLSLDVKAKWTPVFAEKTNEPLSNILTKWPTGEWTLTSRYHACLTSLWGGSKTTVLALNGKLKAVASEFGLAALPMDASNDAIITALRTSKPVDRSILTKHTKLAKDSVTHFRATFGL